MKKKASVTKILLILTILSIENFCCLVPSEEYIIPGLIKFSDIGIIFAFLFFIWVMFFIKFKDKNEKAKYPYKWIIFSFFTIILISSFMAKKFFNQPITWSIRSERQIIACFLLYFPVLKTLQTGVINKEDLVKYITIVATIEMALYTIQYLLINKVVFLHFTYSDSIEIRLNRRRLRYPVELILISAYFHIDNLLNNKGSKFKNIFMILWFFVIMVIMVQKRTQIISFIISLIIIFVLWKKNIGIKVLLSIFVLVLLGGFVFNLSIVQSTIYSISNRGSEEDTLTIREAGIEYYKEKLKSSQLFGFGKPNENIEIAMYESGVQYGYFLADDGIYGFYYIFGLIGIAWLGLFWIKNLKLSYKVYNKSIYVYISYFIYETFDIYLGMKWYYYWPLAISLIIALLSYEYIKQTEERNKIYEKKQQNWNNYIS